MDDPVCIFTTLGPVPSDSDFDADINDMEWQVVMQAVLDGGIHTEDYNIPPLKDLKNAFVGFERGIDQPVVYNWLFNYFIEHGASYQYMLLLA